MPIPMTMRDRDQEAQAVGESAESQIDQLADLGDEAVSLASQLRSLRNHRLFDEEWEELAREAGMQEDAHYGPWFLGVLEEHEARAGNDLRKIQLEMRQFIPRLRDLLPEMWGSFDTLGNNYDLWLGDAGLFPQPATVLQDESLCSTVCEELSAAALAAVQKRLNLLFAQHKERLSETLRDRLSRPPFMPLPLADEVRAIFEALETAGEPLSQQQLSNRAGIEERTLRRYLERYKLTDGPVPYIETGKTRKGGTQWKSLRLSPLAKVQLNLDRASRKRRS